MPCSSVIRDYLMGIFDGFFGMWAGVDVAHQRGIVHRDLKPSNLFPNFDDTSWHVKVMDFVRKAHGDRSQRLN